MNPRIPNSTIIMARCYKEKQINWAMCFPFSKIQTVSMEMTNIISPTWSETIIYVWTVISSRVRLLLPMSMSQYLVILAPICQILIGPYMSDLTTLVLWSLSQDTGLSMAQCLAVAGCSKSTYCRSVGLGWEGIWEENAPWSCGSWGWPLNQFSKIRKLGLSLKEPSLVGILQSL